VRAGDKLGHAARLAKRQAAKTEHDLANRTRGLLAKLRSRLREGSGKEADDEVISERARSALGRVCSHVSGISCSVDGGVLTLSGPILERDYGATLRAAHRVRGVRAVDDRLERHVHPNGIPGLQESRPQGESSAWSGSILCCSDLMKRNVRWISEDDSVSDAAEMMAMANIGFLPVCDRERRVVGTITDRDIVVRAIATGSSPSTTRVGEAMTGNVISCLPDDPLPLAETFMTQYQVSRLVILSEDGKLEGVISLSDIATKEPPRRVGRMLKAVASREAPLS
jgi:CBS domain-containing protein